MLLEATGEIKTEAKLVKQMMVLKEPIRLQIKTVINQMLMKIELPVARREYQGKEEFKIAEQLKEENSAISVYLKVRINTIKMQ